MSLPFSIPPYIQNKEEALEKAFRIECFVMNTEVVGGILIDNSYWLEGYEASNTFYLISENISNPVTYRIASFYADCIAFEHELPTLAIPKLENIHYEDIHWLLKPKSFVDNAPLNAVETFIDHIINSVESAADMNTGLWTDTYFKYDRFYNEINPDDLVEYDGYEVIALPYKEKYSGVGVALKLYNASMRQSDPLSAYLNYYKVLENITQSNGLNWISEQISNTNFIEDFPVWCRDVQREAISETLLLYSRSSFLRNEDGRINFNELLRSDALKRIDELKLIFSTEEISQKLYGDNRCNIAHGRSTISHDLGDEFIEILNDLNLIKFLARQAIIQSL